jgi:adenine deaminase
MDAIRGISRVDTNSTHGWLVRHYINGKSEGKLFSDKKNKSKQNALIKAMMYQIEHEEENRELPRNRKIQKNNHSGINGVSILNRRDHKGKKYLVFVSTWVNSEGKLQTKSFSSKKYGEEEAKKMAIKFRREVEQIYN